MDRRGFIRNLAGKATEKAVDVVDAKVRARASRWIRPPFAIDELEFLLSCSRCGDCIEACPHDVIFSLKASLGADVAGTPALDLTHQACRLCDDWPCVTACEPRALVLPEVESKDRIPPRLASVFIDTSRCLPYLGPECGACADSCPIDDTLIWQGDRPVIDKDSCVGCGQCRQACVLDPSAIQVQRTPID